MDKTNSIIKENKRSDFCDCKRKKDRYEPGDVFFVNLGSPDSHVQGGIRPVIILGASSVLQYSKSLVIQGVPLTTVPKLPKVHVEINEDFLKKSFAMPEQLVTLDVCQIVGYKGRISDKNLLKVKKAVRTQLGLN